MTATRISHLRASFRPKLARWKALKSLSCAGRIRAQRAEKRFSQFRRNARTRSDLCRPCGARPCVRRLPTVAGQHAPTLLDNGNILIFDNGVHRLDDPLPFSRVIEINPTTNEIEWNYQDRPVSNFFSPRMGNAQRLPNGNTLINEASFGRF